MWKIQYLKLKNFKHIKSGLNKDEIELDFSGNDKVLNIFVGKMGTGKSAILGHLQPFSNYGTLDIRNQDDLIIPEKDGKKIIHYLHDDHKIQIEHTYLWNKRTAAHNVRSSFVMDGKELNPTGNVGIFKDLVLTHFGIDQSFLRILRLGPNVANVINMKAAERKAFIATLIQNTDIYKDLYNKMNEDLRKLNASIAILSKKLISLSSSDEKKMQEEAELQEDRIRTSETELSEYQARYYQYDAKMNQIFHEYGQSPKIGISGLNQFLYKKKSNLEDTIQQTEEKIAGNKSALRKLAVDTSLSDIALQLGAEQTKLHTLQEKLKEMDEQYRELLGKIKKCEELIAVRGSDAHLQQLKEQQMQFKSEYARYQEKLQNFKPIYSYHYLADFIDNLAIIKMQINEIASYPGSMISTAYYSDGSLKRKVAEKIDHLNGKIYNLQKEIANIEYTAAYQTMFPLIRPPMCPTKDCPFYRTHPATLREEYDSKKKRESAKLEKQKQIDALRAKIGELEELPILYEKITALKKKWPDICKVISGCGALTESSLYNILMNLGSRLRWYDANRLNQVLELHKMQEDFYTLSTQLKAVESEMEVIEGQSGNPKKERAEYQNQAAVILESIQSVQTEVNDSKSRYHSLEELYQIAEKSAEIKNTLAEQERQQQLLQSEYTKLNENLEKLKDIDTHMATINGRIQMYRESITSCRSVLEGLRGRLSDIAFTKSEYKDSLKEKETMQDIMNAVSTKGGIPLVLVQAFLNGSLDILNDLISDIFADELEIVRFDISDTEFKIPYSVNGVEIADIDTASQGQQSVISIALSFALIRQSMFDYNIMLLDEVDGALYKKDREKFITILFKQLEAIDSNQVFLISHNQTFDNVPANIILTSEEVLEENPLHTIFPLY